MADREPSMLGADPDADDAPAGAAPASVHDADTRPVDAPAPEPASEPAPRAPSPKLAPARASTVKPAKPVARKDAGPSVTVVGFWRRFAAAGIDLAIVLPVAALLTWIASAIAGVHVPRSNMHGPDYWLDLFLASDPALLMALTLFTAIGCLYLYLFQVTLGRTVGMHVLKLRVIDVWGDAPSNARCAVRTAGYVASALTFFLGFLWIGFDSEKRGLHDWIAGTYVIRG